MRRILASLLVALLALMPMSAMAGLDLGAPAQEMPCHSTGEQPDPASCADMSGCCAAFLIPTVLDVHALPGSTPLFLTETRRAGFAPELVDPPPVAP